MAETAVTVKQMIEQKPEHPLPAPGDVVHLEYPLEAGPVGVVVETDKDGFALLTVTAPAEEVAYSIEAARKALVRSVGLAPEDPESLGKAREKYGAMAFADRVASLATQRLFSLAVLRTRILPFLAPQYQCPEKPQAGKDYTFQVRFRLRPRGVLSSYEPVELAFPPAEPVTEEEIDQRLASFMGNIQWSMVPDEAKPALEKLRGQIREQLATEHEAMKVNAVAGLCGEELAKRLVGELPAGYVELLRDEMAAQLAGQVEAQGMKWAEFIAQPDFDMDEFKATMTCNAEMSLKCGLAIDALAEHEGIALDLGDIYAVLGPMAAGNEAEAARAMLDGGQLPQVIEVAIRAKTADWAARHAVDTGKAAE